MKYIIFGIAFLLSISTFKVTYADTIPDNSIIYGIWKTEDSPFIVMGEVTVPADSSLIIEPGVVVLLKSSTNDSAFIYSSLDVGLIKVYGRIVAIGTENDSIYITRESLGNWGSISFMDTTGVTNYLKFCKVSYGRNIHNPPNGPSYIGGIAFYGTNAFIENTRLENNPIGIFASYSNMVIKNCISRWNEDGIICNSSVSQIENNHVYNNEEDGIFSRSSYSIIRSNLIENNLRGIYSYESNDTISNNTVINNLWGGINITRNNSYVGNNLIYGSNSGIRCSGNPRLINNTIVNNNFFGIYCDYEAKPIIINSIIYGNKELFLSHSGDTIVLVNSLVEADSLPNEVVYNSENIFNQYPNFIDTVNNNFELNWNSPCIDGGRPLFIWLNDTILDLSTDQYFGLAPDIGAFESQFTVGENENLIPNSEKLSQNYPNPFTQLTRINIIQSSNEKANLNIYNLSGNLVKTFLINGQGVQTITWNGIDNNGKHVKAGIYFYKLECIDGIIIKKMILKK